MKKKIVTIGTGLILIIALLYFVSNSGFETNKKRSYVVSQNTLTSGSQGKFLEDTQSSVLSEEQLMVEIPPEKQQLIGVKIVDVTVKPLKKTIRTVGRVEFDERKLRSINIKVEGWIEKLYADYSGKYVRKGDPLVEIYSPELMSTQLEYMNLLKWKNEKAHRFQRNIEFQWGDRYGTRGQMLTFDIEALLDVAKQRLKLWEVPDDIIKHIEEGGEPPKTLTIYSPSSGYVFQKSVFHGTRISPGEKIFDVVDLSTVWVIADIYENELPLIKVGQKARITLSYFPEKEFLSKVDFVYPALSGQTRTAKIRFTVPNPKAFLKPQMFVNVEMTVNLGERLAIPEDAVIDTGKRQIVYVYRGEGFFEPRKVKLGTRADGMVEILNGLKEGERVASSATFLIDSESKLRGILPE